VEAPGLSTPSGANGAMVYSIEGPFFFAAAEKLERTLAHIQRQASTLILRMGKVPFVDATGMLALEEMIGDFRRHGSAVLLVELRPNVRRKLDRGGVIQQLGAENVFDTLAEALKRTGGP
jgi:SulP family sulfate permease